MKFPYVDQQAVARFAAMTADEVRAYETDVLRRVADLALIPPRLIHSPGPEYDDKKLDYAMNQSIERTAKGRLWAAWVSGGDSPDGFLVLNVSDDNGESWSKPQLIVRGHSDRLPIKRTVMGGCLWIDPLGTLRLYFLQAMNQQDGRRGLWCTVCDNPDTEQPVWSVPQRIWHGSMLNKPLVLSSGEWLLPTQFGEPDTALFGFEGVFPELAPYYGANVLVSVDQGKSVSWRATVKLPEGIRPSWYEHMMVERKDGSIWMLIRADGNKIMESLSRDKGCTWSLPEEAKGIRHVYSRFFLRRLLSGRLLMVKHGETMEDLTTTRCKLKAFLSEDDGHTWQGGLMLDERDELAYPDGVQAADGTIYITYDRNRGPDAKILLARFTEKDIMVGKITDPNSKLRLAPCDLGSPE